MGGLSACFVLVYLVGWVIGFDGGFGGRFFVDGCLTVCCLLGLGLLEFVFMFDYYDLLYLICVIITLY